MWNKILSDNTNLLIVLFVICFKPLQYKWGEIPVSVLMSTLGQYILEAL